MSYNPNIKARLEKNKIRKLVDNELKTRKIDNDKFMKEWLKNNPGKTEWDYLFSD